MARTPIRTPNRTPLRSARRRESQEFVTPVSTVRKLHRKFDSDDEDAGDVSHLQERANKASADEAADDATIKATNTTNNPEEDGSGSDSDSDEAPEEETISAAAEEARQREREARQRELETRAQEKQKRRERDEALKKQKDASAKARALPADIFDEIAKEDEARRARELEEEQQRAARVAAARKHKRLDDSKTIVQKGPVAVQVLQKKKKLASRSEGLTTRLRDRFLHRRGVARR